MRSELEQARGAHKEAARRAAAAEASLGAAADDAERFRLESDALAESLAETTKRLEAASNDKKTSQVSARKAEDAQKQAQKHSAELAQAEDALSEARAALEASTTAERRAAADAEAARADADARVVTEREAARRVVEDRERLELQLESLREERERDRREHKRVKGHLETKLEDAERRVAVAEISAESSLEARVASASASFFAVSSAGNSPSSTKSISDLADGFLRGICGEERTSPKFAFSASFSSLCVSLHFRMAVSCARARKTSERHRTRHRRAFE